MNPPATAPPQNGCPSWWWVAGVVLLGLLLAFRSSYQVVLTIGNSMVPTLRHGDLVVISKRAYYRTAPSRGDIVLARLDRQLVLKRVVGLPHEAVEVKAGALFVNGRACPETHAIQPGPLDIGLGQLWADRFALLGDNRAVASSVVVHGVVAGDQIIGKAILCVHVPLPWHKYRLQGQTQFPETEKRFARSAGRVTFNTYVDKHVWLKARLCSRLWLRRASEAVTASRRFSLPR